MKAVWSFWTKPYFAGWTRWYTNWHHWLGWGLSVYAARRHYPETSLVTDDEGARILVDKLQLPFDHVSTALNSIDNQNSDWWTLGKLEAYRCQREPFVHIDADVFLWKPLSAEVEEADVFAQNPEPITPGATLYTPEEIERVIGPPGTGWLPKEWTWYRRRPNVQSQCCGVFGGNRVDFINHYASTALRIVTDPRNRDGLKALSDKSRHMLLIEQYLLTACIDYHHQHKRSPYRGIEIRHIFSTVEDAFRPERATEAGFTHLAAGTKRSRRVSRDLELRVRHDLPEYYERCMSYVLSLA